MLEKGINAPLTSSCGRLFDAVSSLLNLRHKVTYDGQAAIELEALAETSNSDETLPFQIILKAQEPMQLDFTPLFPAILSARQAGNSSATLAHRFHATVAQASITACISIARDTGLNRIVLSGGVFQNRLLSEMIYTGLAKQGLDVYTHRLTPPNDGCIALGQAAIAGWQARRKN
jgi:hydrogenase maturation protein HypF